MKLTKEQLKRMIKEELASVTKPLNEIVDGATLGATERDPGLAPAAIDHAHKIFKTVHLKDFDDKGHAEADKLMKILEDEITKRYEEGKGAWTFQGYPLESAEHRGGGRMFFYLNNKDDTNRFGMFHVNIRDKPELFRNLLFRTYNSPEEWDDAIKGRNRKQ